MEVKVHFCSSNLPFALAIKFFTFSQWSHVAIQVGGIVYESRGVCGVTKTTFSELVSRQNIVHTEVVNDIDWVSAREFLEDQVGKDYDYAALFGLPFRQNWGAEDRWFCSELAAKALHVGGFNFLPIKPFRITPKDLFIILRSVNGNRKY